MSGDGKALPDEANVPINEKEQLEGLRMKVKRNDRDMVLLLKKRMELAEEIGKTKKGLCLPVKDPAVEQAVIENALRSAREMGLSPRLVEEIMRMVVAESCLRQEALPGAGKKKAGRPGPG